MSKEADKLYYHYLIKQQVHRHLVLLNDWVYRGCKEEKDKETNVFLFHPWMEININIVAKCAWHVMSYIRDVQRQKFQELCRIASQELRILYSEFGVSGDYPFNSGYKEQFEWETMNDSIYQNVFRKIFLTKYGSRDARDFLPFLFSRNEDPVIYSPSREEQETISFPRRLIWEGKKGKKSLDGISFYRTTGKGDHFPPVCLDAAVIAPLTDRNPAYILQMPSGEESLGTPLYEGPFREYLNYRELKNAFSRIPLYHRQAEAAASGKTESL